MEFLEKYIELAKEAPVEVVAAVGLVVIAVVSMSSKGPNAAN